MVEDTKNIKEDLLQVFFDEDFYLKKITELGIQKPNGSLIEHWQKNASYIVPSPKFDENYYYQRNPDVLAANVDAFSHFLDYGFQEGRFPSEAFEQVAKSICKKIPSKNSALYKLFYLETFFSPRVIKAIANIYEEKLKQIISTDFYYEQTGLNLPTNKVYKHFINKGVYQGIRVNRLFDEALYCQIIRDKYGKNLEQRFAIFHWLAWGLVFELPALSYFDGDFYYRQYKDVEKAKNHNAYSHYLMHGANENRKPNEFFDPQLYIRHMSDDDNQLNSLEHFVYSENAHYCFHQNVELTNTINYSKPKQYMESLIEYKRVLNQRISKGDLEPLIAQAEKIVPEIGYGKFHKTLNQPGHYYSAAKLFSVTSKVKQSVKANYDSVIVIPHCRMSGAARVSAFLSDALLRQKPDASVLLVRTDSSSFEYPNWFASQIDTLDLSELTKDLNKNLKTFVLMDLIRGVKATNVFNLNSRLMWDTIDSYGKQLSTVTNLHSYFFCWDRNPSGQKVGYPAMFFSKTFALHKNIFVDSDYLKQDLIDRYLLPKKLEEKILVLKTPFTQQISVRSDVEINAQGLSAVQPQKTRVFWAGRFDKQKRFDVLIAIARKMPDVEFWFWGKPVLNQNTPMQSLPKNMIHQGVFDDFQNVPFEKCDVWLYTSQWDGMPTILLNVAAAGLTLVSTKEEGCADLVSEDSAWVVDNLNDVEEYIERINSALENPVLSGQKSCELKERLSNEYSMDKFITTLNFAMETH